MMRIIVTLFCLSLCFNGLMAKHLFERSNECQSSPNGEDYTCPQANGMFPHEECTKFWQCSNCYAYAMPCAADLWWNDAKQECDYPENVPDADCIPPNGVKPTTTPEVEETTTEGSNNETTTGGSGNETTIPDESGETTTQGSIDETTTEAATEETTTEADTTTSVPTTTDSEDNDTGATDDPSKPICIIGGEMYHKHTDCRKFWQCSNGEAIEMKCAPGTAWNDEIKVCDWPSVVNCKLFQNI